MKSWKRPPVADHEFGCQRFCCNEFTPAAPSTCIALGRLIVLEVASLPECIAGLAERLGLQTGLGLHGAHHMASVAGALAQDAPHVLHVHGWAVVEVEERRRQVKS